MPTDTTNTDKKESPCGCGGMQMPEMDSKCVAPTPMPWVQCHNCLKWYVINTVTKTGDITINKDIKAQAVTVEFEITYELSLCLKGRQPGKLLYTTSLIPQEELKIYISDRYRRTTSETDRYSVHASFMDAVAAVNQSKFSLGLSNYSSNSSSSSGGGGGGLSIDLGIFSIGGGGGGSASSSSENISSLQQTIDTFSQTLTTASQAVEADRSVVVSSFEEQDNLQTTSRVLKNNNNCRSVTYYVRKIDEVYELSAVIASIRWRLIETRNAGAYANWQSISDISSIPYPALKQFIEQQIALLPQLNDTLKHPACITLTTDGTVLEGELSHCSSCDAEKMLEMEAKIEKEKAEARKIYMESELMLLEIERRRKLLEAGNLASFHTPVTTP